MEFKFLKFMLRHKGSSIASIVGIGSVAFLLLSGSFLGLLELQNLEKLLLRETQKIEQHMEKTASQKIFKLIACKNFGGRSFAVSFGCKGPEENATGPENNAEEAAASAEGEKLTSEIDQIKLNDPAIEHNLGANGIDVQTNPSGEVVGLESSNGSSITDGELENNVGLADNLNTALPEQSVTLINDAEPVLAEDGVGFNGLSATATESESEIDRTIETDVQNGVIDEGLTPSSTASEKNPTTTDQASVDTQNSVENSVKAVQDTLNSGGSEASALAAGESSFNLGKGLLGGAVATAVCSIYKVAKAGATQRVVTITQLLMRHSGLLFSLADQEKVGNPPSSAVDSFMKIIHSKNSKGQSYEQSVGYARSAGLPISSKNTDVQISSLPVANSGTKIVNEASSIVSGFGGGAVCDALTSSWGGLIQGALGVFQMVGDVASLGTLQLAISGAGAVALYEIQHTLIPDIVKYFTVVGLSGIENGVAWINNAFLGSFISSDRIAQSLGGLPMTNSAANGLAAVASADIAKQAAAKPLSSRLFAISNPDSLVSKLLFDIPTTSGDLISSATGYLTSFSSKLIGNLADVFMPSRIYAATNSQSPGSPYGITTYGLTDSQITKYEPIQNESYLYQQDHITLHDKNHTTLYLKRITMTGNPYDFPNGQIDSSPIDIYHCFSQDFSQPSSSSSVIPLNFTSSNNDPICGSEGSLDYENDTPTSTPISESNMLYAYCQTFKKVYSNDNLTDSDCETQLSSQYNDDIGHFTEYILDSVVTGSYYSMMSTQ